MTARTKTGNVLIPLLIGAAIILSGIITFLVLKKGAPTASSGQNQLSVETTKKAELAPTPLVWSSFGTNSVTNQIPPAGALVQTISLGPAAKLQVTVKAPREAVLELRDPTGKVLTVGPDVKITDKPDSQNQEILRTYELSNNTQSGDWRLSVSNPSETTSADYTVSVPVGAPPITVSANTGSVVATSQGVVISITVQETVGTSTVPVSGATVVANVTNPNQETTAITLTQTATSSPGTYTGTYTGDQSSGTYQVEYIINGQSASGDQFTQTTGGTFVVTTEASTTTTYFSKKYDINLGNQVQIIDH